MELARTLRELFGHRRLLAAGVIIAACAGFFAVSGSSLKHSGASTQVLVDAESSVLGSVTQPFEPLASRAQVYANFMASPAFLNDVGKRVGLHGDQIFAAGPVNANEPRVEQEPTDLKRNVQITGETKPYRLNYESQANLPTIGIYAQAPTTLMATSLANAAAASLQSYVSAVESTSGIPQRSQIVIRQLGPASGSVSDGGISKSIGLLVFVAVLFFWCLMVLVGKRFMASWRAVEGEQQISELVAADDRGPRTAGQPAQARSDQNGASVDPEYETAERAPARSMRW